MVGMLRKREWESLQDMFFLYPIGENSKNMRCLEDKCFGRKVMKKVEQRSKPWLGYLGDYAT